MPRSRGPVTAEQRDVAVAAAGRVHRVLLVGRDDGWALLRRTWPELAAALEAWSKKSPCPRGQPTRRGSTWVRPRRTTDPCGAQRHGHLCLGRSAGWYPIVVDVDGTVVGRWQTRYAGGNSTASGRRLPLLMGWSCQEG
jgi:hypothetical protein